MLSKKNNKMTSNKNGSLVTQTSVETSLTQNIRDAEYW